MQISAGGDRKSMLVITQVKGACFKMHLELTALQDASILIAQYREQDFILKIGLERLPLDVEVGRIDGTGAILQDVHPPLIERLADAHVVRDEIDHLPHAM